MTEMLFDTQKMAERLEDAGVPPSQARAHAALLADAIGTAEVAIMGRVATKQEVTQALAEIRVELEKFEARIDVRFAGVETRMAELKSELIRWVVTVGILQMALITALVLKLTP